jgi:inner membrane protein
MPSPVGHSLSGLVVYLALGDRVKRTPLIILFFILISNLPDFDFLPGLLVGVPGLFHRGVSHSICMGMLIGILVGAIYKKYPGGDFFRAALIGFILYSIHNVLDLFSISLKGPSGFQLLWPFSDHYFLSKIGVFMNVTYSFSTHDFYQSLFTPHNLRAIINEFLLFLPGILFFWGIRSRTTQKTSWSMLAGDLRKERSPIEN